MYLEIEPEVWARKESLEPLSHVESLVLDIDGVILDVFSSFRVAISQTTQHYFSQTLGWPGKSTLITPVQTELFKLAGGFNNDWELTFAVVLFYLAKSEELSNHNLDTLASDKKALQDFTDKVRSLGGGLANAQTILLENLTQGQQERVQKLWDKGLVQRIFQEYYGGSNYCERLYGFKPTNFKGKGLLENETTIVDKALIRPFSPKVGVLTGRTREEAELALERASFKDLISSDFVLTDGTIRKPDPKTLLVLGKKMGTASGIYIGDTPDDLETVNNLRHLKSSVSFFSGIVLKKATPSELFIEREADMVARSTDQLLLALLKLKNAETNNFSFKGSAR